MSKDVSVLEREIEALRALVGTTPQALAEKKAEEEQKAREQQAAREKAEAETERRAQAEQLEAEQGAITILATLCAQFDLVDQKRARTRTLGTRILSGHLMETCRGALDFVKTYNPELLGLQPLPTAEEKRRQELKAAIKTQEDRKDHLKGILADPKKWETHLDVKAKIEQVELAIDAFKKQLSELS